MKGERRYCGVHGGNYILRGGIQKLQTVKMPGDGINDRREVCPRCALRIWRIAKINIPGDVQEILDGKTTGRN